MPQAIKTPPNTTYHISRTCHDDLCLLWGSAVADMLIYLLAVVAPVLGIKLHAAAILPDRWDIILTDVRGVVARLFEIVHLAAACWIKREHKHGGSVWRLGRRLDRQILTSADEVLAHTAEVLSGPVRAGLVEYGDAYLGFSTRPESLGVKRFVDRPDRISMRRKVVEMLPGGALPMRAVFETTCPPQFESLAEFQAALTEALAEAEQRARADAEQRFATPEEVRAIEPHRPLTQIEAIDEERAEAVDPHFQCIDADRRKRQCAEQRCWFEERYLPAWRLFTAGRRNTEFPADTYWMFYIAKCEIEAPPPDASLFV